MPAGRPSRGAFGIRRAAVAQAVERGLERSDLGWLIFYALRRRLDEALRRQLETEPADHPLLAVGFVDLVGFTEVSRELGEEALGGLLARFEALTWDVVTEAGGQVVKLIGDEAMLVCPSPASAARAALEILDATTRTDLPAARAGLAQGTLLPRAGDFFGPAVNLASRLVDHAEPGTVVVDEAIQSAVGDEFDLEPLGLRPLKGIGDTAIWKLAGPAVGS